MRGTSASDGDLQKRAACDPSHRRWTHWGRRGAPGTAGRSYDSARRRSGLEPYQHGDDRAVLDVDVVALGVTFPLPELEGLVRRDGVFVHRSEFQLVAPRTAFGEKEAPGAGRELGHEHCVNKDPEDGGVEWILPPSYSAA